MHTVERLKAFAPKAKPEIIAAIVRGNDAARAAGINTPLRLQHFLAQLAHESAGLTRLVENLTYSSAANIRRAWPTRFSSNREAALFVRKPQALANEVYNGRMGNAEDSNDGWTFRGRGLIQTTGRDGYRAMGKAVGQPLVERPELLEDPDIAFAVACKEWEKRGCNAFADRDDILSISKAINLGNPRAKGKPNGMADREEWLAKAKKAFAASPSIPKVKKPDLSHEQIENVQRLLDKAGYPEVGEIDGLWGDRTRGALSTFQLDNDLPGTGEPDAKTLQALALAPPREIGEARRTADAKAVAAAAPGVIQPSLNTQKTGLFATIGAAGAGAISYLREGYEYTSDIREAVPLWAWATILAAVCFYFGWYRPRQQTKSAVESYRAGKVV